MGGIQQDIRPLGHGDAHGDVLAVAGVQEEASAQVTVAAMSAQAALLPAWLKTHLSGTMQRVDRCRLSLDASFSWMAAPNVDREIAALLLRTAVATQDSASHLQQSPNASLKRCRTYIAVQKPVQPGAQLVPVVRGLSNCWTQEWARKSCIEQ